MPRRAALWITGAAWIWTLLILVACWLPAWILPVSEKKGPGIPHLDKLVHFSLFFGFGLLWGWAVAADRRRWLGVLAVGAVLAVLTELGQALPIIQRDAELGDGLADLTGLALGAGLAYLTLRSLARMPAAPAR